MKISKIEVGTEKRKLKRNLFLGSKSPPEPAHYTQEIWLVA